MAPNPTPEKKSRKVTVSGAVPIDLVPRIEEAARVEKVTVSQFVAAAIAVRVEQTLPAEEDGAPAEDDSAPAVAA